jgi:hypothetical protein
MRVQAKYGLNAAPVARCIQDPGLTTSHFLEVIFLIFCLLVSLSFHFPCCLGVFLFYSNIIDCDGH